MYTVDQFRMHPWGWGSTCACVLLEEACSQPSVFLNPGAASLALLGSTHG